MSGTTLQHRASKFVGWLMGVGCLFAVVIVVAVGVWGYRVYAWYTVGYPASLKAKQAFILNPVNQPAILGACRTMLAMPSAFPQPAGSAFPTGMPPVLAALGADSVMIYPDKGVLIMFGRDFGLWVAPATATPPNLPTTGRPLIPGMWYLTYPPGH